MRDLNTARFLRMRDNRRTSLKVMNDPSPTLQSKEALLSKLMHSKTHPIGGDLPMMRSGARELKTLEAKEFVDCMRFLGSEM